MLVRTYVELRFFWANRVKHVFERREALNFSTQEVLLISHQAVHDVARGSAAAETNSSMQAAWLSYLTVFLFWCRRFMAWRNMNKQSPSVSMSSFGKFWKPCKHLNIRKKLGSTVSKQSSIAVTQV